MKKNKMKELNNKKVCRSLFKIIKTSDYVENVIDIGISDDSTHVWYMVLFKDGDTIDIIAPKYNVK